MKIKQSGIWWRRGMTPIVPVVWTEIAAMFGEVFRIFRGMLKIFIYFFDNFSLNTQRCSAES
jgi:hypothetical protein